MTLDEAIIHAEEVADGCERMMKVKAITEYDLIRAKEHRQLAEWLKELKQLREQTRWVSVNERLPKELDHCLCCDEDGYITIGYVLKQSKEWTFVDDDIDIDVVAWMRLPKPYKPRESEEQE